MISTAATQSAGSWRALCPACADGCVCVRVSLLTKVAHQHGEDCALLTVSWYGACGLNMTGRHAQRRHIEPAYPHIAAATIT